MATQPTIPAVSDALVALFQVAVPGLQVEDGRPADSQISREIVFLGDITVDYSTPTMKPGRKAADERYTVDVVVSVGMPGGRTSEAKARVMELWAALRDSIVDDVTLGGLDGVLHVTPTTGGRIEAGQGNEGPVCLGVFPVRVVARLN